MSGSVPSNSRDEKQLNQMKSLLPASTKNHDRNNAPSKRQNDYSSPGKPPTYRKKSAINGNASNNLVPPSNYK